MQELKQQWDSYAETIHQQEGKQKSVKKANISPYSSQIIKNIFVLKKDDEENLFLEDLIGQICFLPDISKKNIDQLTSSQSEFYKYLSDYYKQLDEQTRALKLENMPHFHALLAEEMMLNETGEFSFAYEYFIEYIKKNHM